MKKIKVEYVLINKIKPNEYNPKKIGEKELLDLEKSIVEFGIVDPLIINNAKNRKGIIIGGHQRYKVYQKLKFKEVPVVLVDIPNLEKEKELCLRLSKNTGEWDYNLLSEFNEGELLGVGFVSEELDKIFDEGASEDNFDADKEYGKIKEPKIKLGDLYQLGSHRLLCGSATNKQDIQKLMGGVLAKLVFTSPPYNMAGGMYKRYKDNLKSEEYIKFNLDVIENIKKYLNGFIFWNISYNKNTRWEFIEIIYKIVKETGLKFLELIVWDKGHALPINSKEGLTRRYEDILLVGDEESISNDLELYFLGKNNKGAYFNKKSQKGITNYWKIGTNKTQIEGNSACFPIELPKRGIKLMTDRGDVVLDVFGGSGSTLIGCEQLSRKCFMMEIDPKYCEVIIRRFELLTKQKAKKINRE